MRRLPHLLHKSKTKPTSDAQDRRAHCPFHHGAQHNHAHHAATYSDRTKHDQQPCIHTKHANKKTTTNPKSRVTKRSRHPIAKTLLGLTAFGVGAGVATTAAVIGGAVAGVRYIKRQMHDRRAPLRDFRGLEATNLYRGRAHRDAHSFTLTTPSKTYALDDPMAIIDHLAREQGIDTPFYDIEVCVFARVSRKGKFGYLGHLDYELTVVGRPQGDIQLVR
ncbi:hypothetical protein [Faucicola atlantae]|uniref:hypothetical protein n=1 Tax=Faucicola atlantae TaxID=34059 RepID=UPI0025B1AF37|nr:hypothetical protein [Moraxella atlantae]